MHWDSWGVGGLCNALHVKIYGRSGDDWKAEIFTLGKWKYFFLWLQKGDAYDIFLGKTARGRI